MTKEHLLKSNPNLVLQIAAPAFSSFSILSFSVINLLVFFWRFAITACYPDVGHDPIAQGEGIGKGGGFSPVFLRAISTNCVRDKRAGTPCPVSL